MSNSNYLARVIALLLTLIGISGFSTVSHAWKGDQLAPWVGTMLNGTKCNGGQVPFGPYDYLQRNKLKAQLEVVEESHFNSDVESLTKGMSASAMGDIHYTLQAWPNHHRALNSALRYRLQHRELWSVGDNTAQNYPAECYLQRAMNFSPKDPIPYMLHGLLMHQMKQYEAALKSYRMAIKLQPDDLITQYNMGLALVELERYKEAQKIADKVYAADFPLPGLKRKLAEAKRSKAKANVTQTKANAPAAKDKKSAGSIEVAPEVSLPLEAKPQENDEQSQSTGDNAKKALIEEATTKAVTTPKAPVEQETEAPQEKPVAQSVPDEQTATLRNGATTNSPQLTAKQLAIIQKAQKDQAAKQDKAATNSDP